MKTLYLDTFSGISGDMFLGLLCDLGLDPDVLRRDLACLPVTGYELKVSRQRRHGIEGCRVQVVHSEDHHHRSWSSIDRMLADSPLPEQVRQHARGFFRRLGEAEAKVHGIDIDQVHFHEVGAIDAIVDLTGAAIGLAHLGIDEVLCSPLPLSRGLSRCAHGALPLPAPATLDILQNCPVCDSGCDRELVTPTGATLVRELAQFTSIPARPLGRTGYGVGGWDLEDRPNLLRGILYESAAEVDTEEVCLLETHMDDSTPEQLGYLLEQLLTAGALDAAYAPLLMKKNRPGQLLKVVCKPVDSHRLADLVLSTSSASGIRHQSCSRYFLQRRQTTVTMALGEARIKLLFKGNTFLRLSAEYDDCRRLAQQHNLPLAEVFRQVENSAHARLEDILAGDASS